MKQTERFDHPQKCPNGHNQISWNAKENDVMCWLCNTTYPMSECYHSQGDNPQPSNLE
jgi:hypothetical protein